MKELKFRVWDKKNKCFQTKDSSISNILSLEYQGIIKSNHKNYIFQQFTGLKDKNGKNIFEGDIISLFDAPYKYEILWDKWRWSAKELSGLIFQQSMTSAIYDRAIIVGNIYENPEFLEKL